MRGGKVTEWAEALSVPPRDLPEALRGLYRESVTLHEDLIPFRNRRSTRAPWCTSTRR